MEAELGVPAIGMHRVCQWRQDCSTHSLIWLLSQHHVDSKLLADFCLVLRTKGQGPRRISTSLSTGRYEDHFSWCWGGSRQIGNGVFSWVLEHWWAVSFSNSDFPPCQADRKSFIAGWHLLLQVFLVLAVLLSVPNRLPYWIHLKMSRVNFIVWSF